MSLQQKQFKIILLGDSSIDEYYYGEVKRISPEAPIPLLNIEKFESKKGMSSNVEANLKALGCDVRAFKGSESVKQRFIDTKSGQHLLRVDNDVISNPIDIKHIDFKDVDAVVISDYNKGSIEYKTFTYLRELYSGPIFIDTKKTDLSYMTNCIVKINDLEASKAQSITSPKDLIVTRGSQPIIYKGRTFNIVEQGIVDVCGAGDTFLSSLVYGYLYYKSLKGSYPDYMGGAIKLAIKASSITVQKIGVYAPTIEEIERVNND